MVLDLYCEPLDTCLCRRLRGYYPALKESFHFKTKIIVQMRSCVFLHNKNRRFLSNKDLRFLHNKNWRTRFLISFLLILPAHFFLFFPELLFLLFLGAWPARCMVWVGKAISMPAFSKRSLIARLTSFLVCKILLRFLIQ